MSEAASEAAACDAICAAVFDLFAAYPRFKDQIVDPMRMGMLQAGVADAEVQSPGGDPPRGALLLRGPSKMVKTVALVTQMSKAVTTVERFKPLASRCKWVAAEALSEVLSDVRHGVEGLNQRMLEYSPDDQFVAVVVLESESGEARCQHATAVGVASVDDRGPWYYVLDHGKSRTSERPKFGYNGSLVPFRVSPDRLVPAHIPKPDYYATGQPEVRARAEHARSLAHATSAPTFTGKVHACHSHATAPRCALARRRSGATQRETRRLCTQRKRFAKCGRSTDWVAKSSTRPTGRSVPE